MLYTKGKGDKNGSIILKERKKFLLSFDFVQKKMRMTEAIAIQFNYLCKTKRC